MKRKQLVTINNSGWWYRAKVNAYFKERFHEENKYSFLKGEKSSKTPRERNIEYLSHISYSKFVICPPGIGYDTYRMWEVLSMGGIPVVESRSVMNLFNCLPYAISLFVIFSFLSHAI